MFFGKFGLRLHRLRELSAPICTDLHRFAPVRTKVPANSVNPFFDESGEPSYRRAVLVAQEAVNQIQWDALGGRLLEARYERRITRKELAQRAGYTRENLIRRYEFGEIADPQEDVVFRFAEILGCNPLWLMWGRGVPGYQQDWK
jgi:ribosome-binding protein aMBF1 (putative translation factor)